MKISKAEAFHKSKHSIELWDYATNNPDFGFVYVEVSKGHFQEFYDKESTFMYFIIEGQGTFYLNDEAISVESGDFLRIPPLTRIYYMGSMKMTLITSPSWKAENEVEVRRIDPEVGA